MEHLFTFDKQQQKDYVAALAALAHSGVAWVVATMRSDFFPRCAELPVLAALKEGQGQYDLPAPTFGEIGQMIRFPARDAALRWGRNPDQPDESLDDVLQEVAWRSPGGLPLLQFTLNELFRRRAGRVLTYAAYGALGGLEGALATRAEETLTDLKPEVQATLPALARALFTAGQGDQDPVVSRSELSATLQADPLCGQLVDALIAARLLTADRDAQDRPVVGVVHDALLTRWPRLHDLVDKDREFLRTRTRVDAAAALWIAKSRHTDFLLPEGRPLSEAYDLLKSRRDALEPKTVEFINQSTRYRTRKRRNRLITAVAIAATVMLVVSGFAVFSFIEWRQALIQKRQGQVHRAWSLAESGVSQCVIGEATGGMSALREAQSALPGEPSWLDRIADRLFSAAFVPSATEVRTSIDALIAGWAGTAGFTLDSAGEVQTVQLSPDGRYALTTDRQDETRLRRWDAATGRSIGSAVVFGGLADYLLKGGSAGPLLVMNTFGSSGPRLRDATGRAAYAGQGANSGKSYDLYSPDGSLACVPVDGGYQLKRVADDGAVGKRMNVPRTAIHLIGKALLRAAFSPSGDRLLTFGEVARGVLLGVTLSRDGSKAAGAPVEFQSPVLVARYSPDLSTVFSSHIDGSARLVDTKSGLIIHELPKGGSPVLCAAFPPVGGLVYLGKKDGSVGSWDVATGALRPQLFQHGQEVSSIAVSPDGRTIATGGWAWVKLWDARAGQAIGEPLRHAASEVLPIIPLSGLSRVVSIAFHPTLRRLASARTDGTARLWDLATGSPIGDRLDIGYGPVAVAFVPKSPLVAVAGANGKLSLWHPESHAPPVSLDTGLDDPEPLTAPTQNVERSVPGDPMPPPPPAPVIALLGEGRASRPPAPRFDVPRASSGLGFAAIHPEITCLAVRPDGAEVAVGRADGSVQVVDLKTRKPAFRIELHNSRVMDVCWEGESVRRLTAAETKLPTVQLWDSATALPVGSPHVIDGGVEGFDFSQDGSVLLVHSKGGRLYRWNSKTGEAHGPTIRFGSDTSLSVVAIDRTGDRVVTRDGNDEFQLWRFDPDSRTAPAAAPARSAARGTTPPPLTAIASAAPVAVAEPLDRLIAAVFSPTKPLLLTVDTDGFVVLRQLGERGVKPHFQPPASQAIREVFFSEDGSRFVLVDSRGTVRVYDSDGPRLLGQPVEHVEPLRGVAFLQGSGELMTVTSVRVARLWDLGQSPRVPIRVFTMSPGHSARISPDASLVWASPLHEPQVRTVSRLAPIGTFTGEGIPEDPLTRELQMWDVATGKRRSLFLEQTPSFGAEPQFSDDGELMLTSGRYLGEWALWNLRKHASVRSWFTSAVLTSGAALSSDGSKIVIFGGANYFAIIDAATRKPVGHGPPTPAGDVGMERVTAVAIHPKSPWVAYAVSRGEEWFVETWDYRDKHVIGKRLRLISEATFVAFGAGNDTLLTGTKNGWFQIWNFTAGSEIPPPLHAECSDFAKFVLSKDGTLLSCREPEGKIDSIWYVPTRTNFDAARLRGDLTPHGAVMRSRGELLVAGIDGHNRAGVWSSSVLQSGRFSRPETQEIVSLFSFLFAFLENMAMAATFSPSGSTVYVAKLGAIAELDAVDGHTLRTWSYPADHGAIVALTDSDDGAALIAKALDGSYLRWALSGGQSLEGTAPTDSERSRLDTFLARFAVRAFGFFTQAQGGAPAALSAPITELGRLEGRRAGTYLAVFSDGSVRLHSQGSGRDHEQRIAHGATVVAAAFSPDGRVLLTGGADKSVQFWDTLTTLRLGPSIPGDNIISVVAFSRDGRSAFVGGFGGLGVVLPVPTGSIPH